MLDLVKPKSSLLETQQPVAPPVVDEPKQSPGRSRLAGLNFAQGQAALTPKAAPPTQGAPTADEIEGGPGLADPALVRDDKTKKRETHAYQNMDGRLFVRGVRATDPSQGWIGDCYLVAALSAVAQRNPEKIVDAIRPAGGNIYEVRFYREGRGGAKEVWVKVDADFPWFKDKNTWAYLQSSDKGEIWPSLIEKAYAVFTAGGAGDYDAVGQGGWEGDLMFALTGRQANSYSVATTGDDALWERLVKASAAKQAMTAGTYSPKDEHNDPRYGDSVGIYGNHAYTVLGVREAGRGKAKQRFVKLRNPWGSGEPTGNGKDDGVFEITLAAFKEKYEGLTVLDG